MRLPQLFLTRLILLLSLVILLPSCATQADVERAERQAE